MSKNKAARRAQKKHKKEKKRQEKRAQSTARAADSAGLDHYFGWRAELEPVRALLANGMGPALAERYAEQYQAEFGRTGRLLGRKLWLRNDIDALSETEVLEKLKALDVSTDRDAFRALAEKYVSAWELAEKEWIASATKKLALSDEDFLCAAARVQWSRWIPERSSREALDELLSQGYDAFHEDDFRAGVDRSLEFWGALRRELGGAPKRYADADALMGESDFVRSWLSHLIQRFVEQNVVDLEVGTRLEQLIVEFLDVFAAEPVQERVSVEFERGGLMWTLARDAEAEALYRRLVEEHPTRAEGYVGLARMLHGRSESEGGGYRAALELLEKAKSRCSPEQAEELGLESEIAHMKRHLEGHDHEDRDAADLD